MGCGASAQSSEPPRQLVLLGGGECGKTTIFKQIQILHGAGFKEQAEAWKPAIHKSPLRSMKVLLAKLKAQGKLDALDDAEKARVGRVEAAAEAHTPNLTPGVAADIAVLWKHPMVNELLAQVDAQQAAGEKESQSSRLDLDDNAKFFLNAVEKIAAPGFVPSNEEILKVRDPTRTIETMDFDVNKAKFRVIDVGGQRMERPKWNLTGEITAVIFVCALTEYTQVLREDIKQNRLRESLNLFDIACNHRYKDKPIILFLNKKDLFDEMASKVDLNVCFPTYKGGTNPKSALEYIQYKFKSLLKEKDKEIYIKVTTATDSENMKFILDSVYEIVLRQNLANSGFG